MRVKRNRRIIISGGGTGGHIFPAISIANALREAHPETEILFVGAQNRMEMDKVPAAGYRIQGLPVMGFKRSFDLSNLSFPFKLWRSVREAGRIIDSFKPNAVVGVGGYASGPTLWMAQRRGIPTLIQEQNSYAGITNKLLARKADVICVAYHGMQEFFPKDKIIITGNPVRQGFENVSALRDQGLKHFGIPKGNRVVLVLGGSLGARTINSSISGGIDQILNTTNTTLLWQTGKLYIDGTKRSLEGREGETLRIFGFIDRMDLAYGVADLVVSRAGASTISELCTVGKPAILVPSPNVAEDHQTKNAQALASRGAAIIVTDMLAPQVLTSSILHTLNDTNSLDSLSGSIKKLALPNAAERIAELVMEIAGG